MFGRKDFQQWRILARMAQDLDMPIEVVGCPIVREAGWARPLLPQPLLCPTPNEPVLLESCRGSVPRTTRGARESEFPTCSVQSRKSRCDQGFDRVDYVAAVDPDTLLSQTASPERLLIAVAAHLGTTRLIDNVVLGDDPRP